MVRGCIGKAHPWLPAIVRFYDDILRWIAFKVVTQTVGQAQFRSDLPLVLRKKSVGPVIDATEGLRQPGRRNILREDIASCDGVDGHPGIAGRSLKNWGPELDGHRQPVAERRDVRRGAEGVGT